MKKLTALLAVILAIVIISPPIGVQAKRKTYKSGKFTYKVLSDGTAEIIGFSGKKKADIPSKVNGHKVSTLGWYSIEAKTVVIPRYVVNIKSNAFGEKCCVKKFIVSGENKRFSADKCGVLFNKSGTTLELYPCERREKTYSIPNGVKEIASEAFYEAPIKSVTFPDTLEYIDKSAFWCCLLKEVSIPPSVKEIGDSAFSNWENSKLVKITLSEGLKIIGKGAFEDTKIKEINIPSTVMKIGSFALSAESLKSIKVAEGNHIFYTDKTGALYNRDKKELVTYPRGKKINSSFTVPEGVEKIGAKAFAYQSLKTVRLPEGLKEIGTRAFYNSELKTVALPTTVKKIGSYAFANDENESLKSVKLKEGLEEIGNHAFEYLSAKNIILPSTLKTIGKSAFIESKLEKVDIPANVKTISSGAFSWCNNLKKVTLHKGLKEIGSDAFYHCTKLKKISLPSSLEKIGQSAFCSTGLTKITLPRSVREIKPGAFSYMNETGKIISIAVAKGNKFFSVKSNVLYDKKRTTLVYYPPKTPKRSFTTPKTVRIIEKYAVVGAKFDKLVITGNVKRIGKRGFYHSTATKILIKSGLRYIDSEAFSYTTVKSKNGWNLNLPNTVKKIGECAFWDSNLTKVNIPMQMTEIVINTFGNTLLTEITIPPTVKKIEYGAFNGLQNHFIIRGKLGSAAEKYAKKMELKFVTI